MRYQIWAFPLRSQFSFFLGGYSSLLQHQVAHFEGVWVDSSVEILLRLSLVTCLLRGRIFPLFFQQVQLLGYPLVIGVRVEVLSTKGGHSNLYRDHYLAPVCEGEGCLSGGGLDSCSVRPQYTQEFFCPHCFMRPKLLFQGGKEGLVGCLGLAIGLRVF